MKSTFYRLVIPAEAGMSISTARNYFDLADPACAGTTDGSEF